MKIIKALIVLAVVIALSTLSKTTVQAQERHDIRLSWALGARGNYGLASHSSLHYVGDLDNTPQEPREGATTWLSATLDYSYRVN
jgi:hypothetical protein